MLIWAHGFRRAQFISEWKEGLDKWFTRILWQRLLTLQHTRKYSIVTINGQLPAIPDLLLLGWPQLLKAPQPPQ